MYKRDYHPDKNIVFDTKNYGFTNPKSAGLEPLSNALVQIDSALKKEETERIEEDVRINRRVDAEIVDRKNADNATNARFLSRQVSNIKISGDYGGCYGVICVTQKIDNVLAITCSGNMYGAFDLPLSKLIGDYTTIDAYGVQGSIICVVPKRTGTYGRVTVWGNSTRIQINTGMDNTTDINQAIPMSFTILIGIKP